MNDADWSATARSVWGKSGGFDGLHPMSLPQHLEDAADVAAHVWRWLPTRVRSVIEAALPESARHGQVLLAWLAGVHDVGKCSPPFASKVPFLADRMRERGFVFPADSSGFATAHHGIVGQIVLTRWLRKRYGARPAAAETYAVVVGGHHGVPPTESQLAMVDAADLVGRGRWIEVQDEILDRMARRTGAEEHLAAWARHGLDVEAQALLTGAVIVCDWMASDEGLFPFDLTPGEPRAALAWEELGLPDPWSPAPVPSEPDAHFASRFPQLGRRARPVQHAAVEAARTANATPLLILEAGMGSGKTEAALMAVEVLAERFGCGGVFFGLPTMATSDGMFGRVVDWVERLDGAGPTSTFLAHGKANLNDDYDGLRRPSRISDIHDPDASNRGRAGAQVLSWLTGRKKGVLATMVVGTVDQLLFVALQAKHAALRHLAMAGKVVVVDEVHANDDFMRMYLCRALEWLAAYGTPVVLLSATLPSSQRQQLVDAYRRGLGCEPTPIPSEAAYPLLTTVSADRVEPRSFDSGEHSASVSVRCLDDETESLTALLEEWLVDGGCVAVVRNTVARAQAVATALRARFGDDVELHHSRYLASHRARREARLRAQLGRSGASRPRRRIVVGTQVLEQSLDIDFDAMVTDLAPVDLVLQRLGRVHRHHRSRPAALAAPQVRITGIAEWTADGPQPVRGSTAVYGSSRLIRSAGALGLTPGGETTVVIPRDLRPLVEAAYADEPPVPPAWLGRAREADASHASEIEGARGRAEDFRMASIDDLDDTLIGWLADSSREAESSTGSARVRDGEDGIEVIVVHRGLDEVRLLDDGGAYAGRSVSTMGLSVPPPELARALAAATVRLPVQVTRPSAFDATVTELENNGFEGFQQSPWLAGHLVMTLDDLGATTLGEFHLRYDTDDGLVVTTLAKEES